MRQSVRPLLGAAVALTLLGVLPFAVSPAQALVPFSEIILNSSNVQVVHNPTPNTDVLNMSLNVTVLRDGGGCEGGADDFIATGFSVLVLKGNCGSMIGLAFSYTIPGYVTHHIGSATYGTYFALKPPGTVSSKIVALTTPPNTCGTWQINFQATGQDLEYLDINQIALVLNDSDHSGPSCFDANAQIGNGITKPARGAHRARR
jgi:hypothetical protein